MNPELITLIINIIFISLLAFGFLLGLKGVKKATSSLCSFLVALVVILFLAGPVSRWVLNLVISGETIETKISDGVQSAFGDSIANSDVAQNLIKSIPVALVNIVVCILLILIIGTIFKIVGNIIYKLIFGKDDKKVVEEVEIVNDVPQMKKRTIKTKKHRLLGGFIGLIHGFLLAFVLFMPVIGIVNLVNEIAGTNEVSAEVTYINNYVLNQTEVCDEKIILLSSENGNTSFELKPAKELLKENLPEEFYSYAKALDNSILAKIGKVGNMAEVSLNIVARCEINGQTIKLGQEVRTLANAYDEFVDFATEAGTALGTTDINVIFNDIVENPNNYDFNKLYILCDHLFESNLVKALGNDVLKVVADSLVEQDKENVLLLRLQTAVKNYCANNYNLKDDVKAMLGTFEISAKSGLINACKTEPFDINNVTDILLNEKTDSKAQDEVLTQMSNKITSSNLLQKILIEATNYGSYYLQTIMNENIKFNNDEKVVLPVIDSAKDIRITSSDLTKVVSGGFKVYNNVIDELEFDAISKDFYVVFDYDLKSMLNIVGEELDTIVNMQLFKDTQLFTNICEAMSNSEYSKYLSFNEIPKGSNIKTQLSLVGDSINELKKSNIISILKNIDEANKNSSYDSIIDELDSKDENNVTLSTNILKPILSCSIFKNTIIFGLNETHTVIQNAMNGLVAGEDVVISPFNTSNIMSENNRNQILNIVNKIVAYAKDIEIEKLAGDSLIDTLIDSNLSSLGVAFDEIKNSNLFSKGEDGSAYNDIIKALSKSDLNKVLDFSITTEDNFTWSLELKNLQTTINDLNTIKIPTTEGEKGLVSFMLNGGDFNDAYDYINAINSRKVQPIFEIKLVKPLAVNIVNTINAKIKDFVGEDLGSSIKAITDINSVNIYRQAIEITDVISAAVEIDFNESDLDNIDKLKLNNLLAKLEINANNDGVFKASYNALLLKTANMINENIMSFVGNLAGSEIKLYTASQSVLNDSQSIINVLNVALDTVKTLKNSGFKDIDTDQLFVLINTLKMNSTIGSEIFKESYNAIMVYIVNEVNSQISSFVGSNLSTGIEQYNGKTSIGSKYNYVKELIECAVKAYKEIPEGKELQDISSESLGNLLDALDSLSYTRIAYNALNNKLANIVIEGINEITGSSIATISSVQNLNSQAQDIKDIIDISLVVAPSLKGKSLKIENLSSDDKSNMAKLLNALQTNGLKNDGVFKNTYNSIFEYVATQNGTTQEDILSTFGKDGIIDWNSFANS